MMHSPWVAGEFVLDRLRLHRRADSYRWPSRSSYFGIIDLAGFPKDRYYFYLAVWRPEPLVHLLPHWNWEGWEGKEIPVWAATNCDSVELFLNGKSLGEKKLDRDNSLHVEWQVPYGRNAEGSRQERRQGSSDRRSSHHGEGKSFGAAAGPRKNPRRRRRSLVCHGSSCGRPRASMPRASDMVQFHLSGPASIAGVDDGNPICHEPFKGDKHSVFHGLGLCVVRSAREAVQSRSRGGERA